MRYILPFVFATLLCATSALAQNDFTYMVEVKPHETKTIKIALPAGNSDVEIGSFDLGAKYTAQLFDTSDDVVMTCDQYCVGHVEKLGKPIKVKLTVANDGDKSISLKVWVHKVSKFQ